MAEKFDRTGIDYAQARSAYCARIEAAFGDAQTVLNVGAGAGSDEPAGRILTAVDPSAMMIAQRPSPSTRVVQGVAEDLRL